MPASAPSIGVGGNARAPRLDDVEPEAERPSRIELRRYEPNADDARVVAVNDGAHVPGLDGLRALAVCVVIAYHLPAPILGGGFLGVSVFFTLSGYLITSLLLRELLIRNAIDLRAFWLRRARRLLPALLLVLVTVLATVALAQPERLTTTALEVLGALSYSSNWLTILSGDDYFRRIAGPGPLDHLWSLAVEEQFYIVWPLLVLALAKGRGRTGKRNAPLTLVTVLLTVASTACIWRFYEPASANPTRAYEGTDARAAAVLLGALAALLAPLDRGALVGPKRVSLVGVLGLGGVFGIALLVWSVDEQSSFLYRGGELLLAACSALVAVAATHRHTVVARALGVRALRWIGARSYGLYLWHLPVIAFMPQPSLALHPILHAAVVVLVVFLFACASHRWLEEPIRRRAPGSRVALIARGLTLAAVATGVMVVGPTLLTQRLEPAALAAEREASEALLSEPTAEEAAVVVQSFPAAGALGAASEGESGVSLTSCREMIHIGDSTSIGLISKGVLPNPEDRVGARYQAVGVEKFFPEISGARSMVETFEDRPNATQVARKYRRSNFKGCWVLALGTNDPANTSGNVEMLSARIATMMTIVGEDPVIWTTTKTRLDKGPYRNANMEKWNQTIADACGRYPNLRVYDWAAEVKDEWFNKDGIHFNSAGCKERAARFARALAIAFPKDRVPPSQCLIRTSTE